MTATAAESIDNYDDVQTIYHLMTEGEPITLIDESGNEVAPRQWDKDAVFQSMSENGLSDAEIVYYMLKYGEPIACEDSTDQDLAADNFNRVTRDEDVECWVIWEMPMHHILIKLLQMGTSQKM